jgi:DNA (cytosine-5)-methyltransferase 3A
MKKAFADVITERLGVEPIEINSSLVSAQNRKRLYWTNIPNVQRPADRGIVLCDILENGLAWRDKSYTIDANYWKTSGRYNPERQSTRRAQVAVAVGYRNRREEDGNLYRRFETSGLDKANALTTVQTDSTVALGISCHGRKDKSENHTKPLVIAPGTDGEPIYEVCNGEIEIMGRKYKINLPDGVYAIRKFTPTECERLQTLPDGYTEGVSKTWRYRFLGNGWTVDVIAHILKSLA